MKDFHLQKDFRLLWLEKLVWFWVTEGRRGRQNRSSADIVPLWLGNQSWNGLEGVIGGEL